MPLLEDYNSIPNDCKNELAQGVYGSHIIYRSTRILEYWSTGRVVGVVRTNQNHNLFVKE